MFIKTIGLNLFFMSWIFSPAQSHAQKKIVDTPAFSVTIQQDPFAIIFKDNKGKIITKGISSKTTAAVVSGVKHKGQWERLSSATNIVLQSGGYKIDCLTESGKSVVLRIAEQASMILMEMKASENVEAIGYAFRAFPDEHFSGMGQRFNSLNLRGQEIPTYDQPWTVPIPFFISDRGYGIYVKTDGKFTFDMCSRTKNAYSFWVEQSTISFYFIYGSSPKEIVKQYTMMTGIMLKPPAWEFGLWKWRDWVFDETEVYEDASMLRSLDIPASVIFIDSPWSNEYIDYEFNPKQFPYPEKLINDLHRLGYRVLLWMVPFINPAAKNYKEADENGYFVKDSAGKTYQIEWWIPSGTKEIGLTSNGKGGMIDFTNPEAVKWWQRQITKVVDLGIDGFKMDDCEHLPDDAYLFNGKRGSEMKNYPLLYDKAVHDLMQQRRKGDFVLIPRAGSAGSQKYVPAFWAADQSPDFDFQTGLPSVIRGGQSIGLVGFPFWGSDIGGYKGAPTKEVFIRWTQFGAFSPIMEVGGKSYHEPWMFDDETVKIFRHYAHLHTYLYPYISYYTDVALKEGIPLMRPLFLEFPEDKQAYKQEFEYMFGKELLVAPIYQSTNSRSIYLPQSTWLDFWSQQKITGPKKISFYQAPLKKIPLFVRVSQQALSHLYIPLFYQQLQGFEKRINYILLGEKKILLKTPAKQLRAQLNDFIKYIPPKDGKINSQAFEDFQESIKEFRTFLLEGLTAGTIPLFVQQTLTERLEAMELSVKSILALNKK